MTSTSRFADRGTLLDAMRELALEAGQLVREAFEAGCPAEEKGEGDVVTAADRAANALLVAGLGAKYPGVPIVAEESDAASYAGFDAADAAFFVDPLDGTREFVARRDEFVVMIGLAERGRATAGVIYAPTKGLMWLGDESTGAFARGPSGELRAIHVRDEASPSHARVVISRSRSVPALARALERAGVGQIDPLGSAGVKAVTVAAGEADAYVHLGHSGSLWDACAPEAIVRAAGGWVSDALGGSISYATSHVQLERGVLLASRAIAPALLTAIAATLARRMGAAGCAL